MSLTGTIPVLTQGDAGFAVITTQNHNRELTFVQIYIQNREDQAHNISGCTKIKVPCSYCRRDLQHPGVPVDRGELPPNSPHLLYYAYASDRAGQREIHLQ